MKRILFALIVLTLLIMPATSSAKPSCNKQVASQITQSNVLSVKCIVDGQTHIMIAIQRNGYAVGLKRGSSGWRAIERVRTSSTPLVGLTKTRLQVSTYNADKDRAYAFRTWTGSRYVTTTTQKEKACVLASDFFAVISSRNMTCKLAQDISFEKFPAGWACKTIGPSSQYRHFDEGRCTKNSRSFSWVLTQKG